MTGRHYRIVRDSTAMPWSFLRLLPFPRGSRLHAVTRSAVLPGGYVPAVVYERCWRPIGHGRTERLGRRPPPQDCAAPAKGAVSATVPPAQWATASGGQPELQVGRGMCGQWGGGRPRKSPNPARPDSDLAGKIAGIFPIPIGPGSGEHSGFSPDSRFGRDFGKSGNPEIVGVGKIAGICASINQDQDRPGPVSGSHFLLLVD